MTSRILTVFLLCLRAAAQAPAQNFDALRQALDLTDAQLQQLQPARSPWPGAKVLNGGQRIELGRIAAILLHPQAAITATHLGLLSREQAPRVCPVPDPDFESLGLSLSDAQLSRFRAIEVWTGDEKARKDGTLRKQLLDVLTAGQRRQLAEFENDWELAREAVALGLTRGIDYDGSCH